MCVCECVPSFSVQDAAQGLIQDLQQGGGGCPNLGRSGGMLSQENFEKFTPLKGNVKAFQVICSYIHLYLSC